MKKKLTYRITNYITLHEGKDVMGDMKFYKKDGYVATAWSDDGLVCLGTTDYPSYTDARHALNDMVAKHAPNAELAYFDGEYTDA